MAAMGRAARSLLHKLRWSRIRTKLPYSAAHTCKVPRNVPKEWDDMAPQLHNKSKRSR